MKRSLALVAAVTFLLLSALPPITLHAAVPSQSRVTFTIPSSIASSGPVLDDRHIVYDVAMPRAQPPVCVGCGERPFTNFHVQVFVRSYQLRSTPFTVSPPRLLFVGPHATQIGLYSLVDSWLVYSTYTPSGQWQLIVRNVLTGRSILLDSPKMEGLASRFLHAGSDGKTVVWQSWTRVHGRTTSVIRSYTLATGRRQLLLSGGHGSDYFYGDPQIAGIHLIIAKATGSYPASQLLVKNLANGRLRALTTPGGENAEPFISGNVVVWVHGSLTLGHTHGLVVENLATGRRVALKHSSSQLPQIAAGRYVVFALDYPTARPAGSVEVYDTAVRRQRTIVRGPDGSGFAPTGTVAAGGHAALVAMTKPCNTSNGMCRSYFMLISLGP